MGLLLTIGAFACAGVDEDRAPAVSSASHAVATEDTLDLEIEFAGDASGQILVAVPGSGNPAAICAESCSVPLTAGESFDLIAVTPSTFAGWGGACSGTGPVCRIIMVEDVTAEATFAKGPGEEWTLLLPDRALSADFDPHGDLVIGTRAGLHKVSSDGEQIWSQPAVSGRARVDPDGDIFAVAGDDLVKVCGQHGTVEWTVPLGPDGCAEATVMGHTFETSPGGDVVIQQGSTLRVFDGAGNERWSATVPRVTCAVAVNSQGVIHTAAEDPVSIEPTILSRFTADGVRLPDTDDVTHQYTAAVAFDPSDFLLASSSGHGDVHLLRWSPALEPGYARRVETSDSDFLDNGVAADANGHAAWAFSLSESNSPVDGVRAEWIDPDGTVDLTVTRASFRANDWTFGVLAQDVAADDGNFVLVGEFGGPFGGVPMVGWVQAYRP